MLRRVLSALMHTMVGNDDKAVNKSDTIRHNHVQRRFNPLDPRHDFNDQTAMFCRDAPASITSTSLAHMRAKAVCSGDQFILCSMAPRTVRIDHVLKRQPAALDQIRWTEDQSCTSCRLPGHISSHHRCLTNRGPVMRQIHANQRGSDWISHAGIAKRSDIISIAASISD